MKEGPMRRLNTILDLRRYLAGVINRLDAGGIDANVASKLGYLCSILHRVLQDSDLDARLTALETKISNQEVIQNARKA